MRLLQCILEHNDCYKKYLGKSFDPEGIVVHSTDPAGEVIRRFVQPFSGQTTGMQIDGKSATADQMIALLGKNKNANDWNRPMSEAKCVHAFVGRIADGSYAVCQTLPFTAPCWGAGFGPKGSYNGCLGGVAKKPLYVQFEMIEGAVGNSIHATRLYNEAVDFCVYLCRLYPTIKLDNIVSHKEAHSRGYGSNHGDPEGYWKRSGVDLTMARFRADVKKRLEDYVDMTTDEVKALVAKEVNAAVATAGKVLSDNLEAQLNGVSAAIQTGVAETLKTYLGKYVDRIDDIPWKSVRNEMRTLLDCGAIDGGTDNDPDDIYLPLNLVRVLAMCKRYTDYVAGGGSGA